jgi:hypothetical protein
MAHLVRHAFRKAPPCALLRERHKRVLRRGETFTGFLRIFGRTQLFEREAALREKRVVCAIASGYRRNSRVISCGFFQMPFGIGFQELSNFVDTGLSRGCRSRHPAARARSGA